MNKIHLYGQLLILIGVCSIHVSAQDLPTMPSPTQASISKYGEVPVNLQTGKINYTIPLPSVKYKDLTLPIELRYNVDGIQLSSSVSWVGTGWDLFAGGSINRVMKGNPDEWSTGYYYTGDDTDFVNFINQNVQGSQTSYTSSYSFPISELGYSVDPTQDVFYFDIGGVSGKFVLEPGNDIAFSIPRTGIKIKANIVSNNISSFVITASDGTKYTFGDTNNSQEKVDNSTLDYTSTWYLTKVESPVSNAEINLVYKNGNTQDIFNYGFEAKYNPLGGDKPTDVSYNDATITRYYYKKLDYIETPLEKIEFNTSSTGVSTGAAATKASPVNKLSSVIYFSKTANANQRQVDLNYTLTSSQRLFLDNVINKNGIGVEENRYEFEYYNKTQLPGDRASMGIDLWGYFNNRSSHNSSVSSYIPSMKVHMPPSVTYEFYEGANREVNTSVVHYGALKKIIYPTGGSTEIQYEPNDYSKALFGPTYNGEPIISKMQIRNENFAEFVDMPNSVYNHHFNLLSDNFTNAFNYLDFQFKFFGNDCNAPFNVKLYKDEASDQLIKQWSNVTANFSDELGIDESGNYYFKVTAPSSLCIDPVNYNIILDINEDVIATRKYGPGVRVKKTITKPSDSSIEPIINEYVYGETINGTYTSYGVIFQEPKFYFKFPSDRGYIQSSYGTGDSKRDIFWGRISNPILTLGGDSRGFLGYSKIKILKGEIGVNGYEEHFYNLKRLSPTTFIRDDYENIYIGNQQIFPAGPDVTYKSSDLLESRKYDENSNLLSKSSSSKKYHDQILDANYTQLVKKFPSVNLYTFRPESKLYTITYNYSIWQRPETDSVFIYNATGVPVMSTTSYIYDDLGIQQITEKTEVNSDGQQRQTEYSYAHEKYVGMGALNMLVQPYSVAVRDGVGTLLSKTYTLWKNWGGDAWRPCEQKIWRAGDSPTASPTTCSQ